jgi:AraC-like DNA-binding protein
MPAPSAPPQIIAPGSEIITPGIPPLRRRVIGRDTRETVLRNGECAGMLDLGMLELAHVAAGAFYAIARAECPLALVAVCGGGGGRVSLGRQAYVLGAGQALLIPAGLAHEFRADEGGWDFSLFLYLAERFPLPEVALVRLHSRPVSALVEALVQESHADADPVVQRRLVELIDMKLRQMANPVARADQLGPVWAEVARRPGEPWDLPALASIVSISPEHLRRLSRRETGRTPMEQVAWMRIQKAASLLTTTNDVVEEIAAQVGYASVRAFRTAFIRVFGRTPKAHRDQAQRSFSARADRGGAISPHLNPTRDKGHEGHYPETRGARPWRQLDLAHALNTRFAEGSRPWFGQPLHHARAGLKRIHGVPFAVAKGCALLRSARLPADADGRPLPESLALATPKHVVRAYFLHACGWGSRSGAFAAYRWLWADGGVTKIPLHTLGIAHPEEPEGREANIQDWYFAYDHVTRPQARPYDLKPRSDPTATSQYLYTLEWINPEPARALAALEVVSLPGCDATLALLAVTVETTRAAKARRAA